jgi:hypothetical protein
MIGRAIVLLLLFVVPVSQAQDELPRNAVQTNPLVGTWRLIRFVDTPKGGDPVHVFGESPIGQFIFTADGTMSVQVMHNPPKPKEEVADPNPAACAPTWYCAYFGTYTVDATATHWTTHVLGGNIVSYIGTDQTRNFKIQGNRLVISETYLANGVSVAAERILVRDMAGHE